MVRIRDITDPELRQRVINALAERRGVSRAEIPHWFEMDDADYSELLMELNQPEDIDTIEPPKESRD